MPGQPQAQLPASAVQPLLCCVYVVQLQYIFILSLTLVLHCMHCTSLVAACTACMHSAQYQHSALHRHSTLYRRLALYRPACSWPHTSHVTTSMGWAICVPSTVPSLCTSYAVKQTWCICRSLLLHGKTDSDCTVLCCTGCSPRLMVLTVA